MSIPDLKKDGRWAHRPPRQERGRRTLDRIASAAEKLLQSRPFEKIPLSEIIREAGTNTGSFYALFASKDALLPLLYERYDSRLDTDLARALGRIDFGSIDLSEAIRELVGLIVSPYLEQPWMIRAMAIFARTHPEGLAPDVYERRSAYHDRLVLTLKPHHDRIRHEVPDEAIRFGLFMVASTARDKLLFDSSPHAHVTPLTHQRLRDELSHALESYLTS